MNWQLYTSALVGSVLQEVMYWYRIREKTAAKKYQDMMRSRSYWSITVLVIGLGSVATFLYFGERLSVGEMLIAGAAFPTLFKRLVATVADKNVTTLGSPRTRTSPADYLTVA